MHTAVTLLRERQWPQHYVEGHLARKDEGMSGEYDKTAYFILRRNMMQGYADYLDALAEGMMPDRKEASKESVNN